MTTNLVRVTKEEFEKIATYLIDFIEAVKNHHKKCNFWKHVNNYLISDNVVQTFSINDTEKVLLNNNIKKYGITLSENTYDNYQILKLSLNFNNGLLNIEEKYLLMLVELLRNLGWELTTKISYNNLIKTSGKFSLLFKPKHSILLAANEIPNKLFCLVRKDLIDDIHKNGLSPNGNELVSFEQDKIYLFMDYPLCLDTNDYEDLCLIGINGKELNENNCIYMDENSAKINCCFTTDTISTFILTNKSKIKIF